MEIANVNLSTSFMDYVSNSSQMVGFNDLPDDTKERIFEDFCTEENVVIDDDTYKKEAIDLVSFTSKYPVWHNIGEMSWCEHLEAISQFERSVEDSNSE